MLISHRKNFIFTKTSKTAGTSIESYFEKYCMPEGEWEESHAREEYISDTGIIGYRGSDAALKKPTWVNHLSAQKIRELIGSSIWDKYFKFTVIRNPFDKLISAFHFQIRNSSLSAEKEIELFTDWIKNSNLIIDRDRYFISDEVCVDYFIRFEDLDAGVNHVCNKINVPFEPWRIPEFKKGIRHHRIKIKDYYTNETEDIVRKNFDWEFNKFGYDLPQ